MKSTFVFLAMLCAVCMTSASAQTGVFRVKILLPVLEVQIPEDIEKSDKIVTNKLGNDEIINLALGRAIDTKVNKETEVLAAAVTFEDRPSPDDPDPTPKSQLIVYDPTKNGTEGRLAVVGEMNMVRFDTAFLSKGRSGFGAAQGKILATELGDPSKNGFKESIVQGAGRCSGKFLWALDSDADASPKGIVTIQGQVNYVYTDDKGTHTVNGFVTNGLGKVSGKPIGGWEDQPL